MLSFQSSMCVGGWPDVNLFKFIDDTANIFRSMYSIDLLDIWFVIDAVIYYDSLNIIVLKNTIVGLNFTENILL